MRGMKSTVVAVATLMLFAACGQQNGKSGNSRYFLLDRRTQMPVMSCAVPPDWLAGGKTTWTAEPSQPVNWYVWIMSPDQRSKVIISSLAVLPAVGRLRTVPFLRDPNILANTLLAGAQRDHNLSDVRLVEARFNSHEPDRNLLETRMRQAREHGIRPTDFYFTELFIRYEGRRGGEKVAVNLSLPMLATENRPTAMSYSTVVELMFPMSFSCPAGEEETTRQVLENMVKSLQLNPEFVALVNHISAQRTANWIRIQNEIRDKQLESAASASATQDKVRNMWSEYIRDVDTVADPGTGKKMLLDNRYDHAWINGSGEVIYHNSGFNTPNASTASFDPNSNALFNQSNWRKLK